MNQEDAEMSNKSLKAIKAVVDVYCLQPEETQKGSMLLVARSDDGEMTAVVVLQIFEGNISDESIARMMGSGQPHFKRFDTAETKPGLLSIVPKDTK